MVLQSILLDIIPHVHPIWDNVFFYLFLTLVLVFSVIVTAMIKALRTKTDDTKLMQQQHVAKIDIVRKEQADTLERIRLEMLNREEERGRQWMESEKETLRVLSGVSTLLDLSEKIGRVESEKILSKLDEIQKKVEEKSEK